MMHQANTADQYFSIIEVTNGKQHGKIIRSSQLQDCIRSAAENNNVITEIQEIEFTSYHSLGFKACEIINTAKALLSIFDGVGGLNDVLRWKEGYEENYYAARQILNAVKDRCDETINILDCNNEIFEFCEEEKEQTAIN